MSTSATPTSDRTASATTSATTATAFKTPDAPGKAATAVAARTTASSSLSFGDSASSFGASGIPIPRRLGSISGLRTVSGSISGLQGTGSFDDIAWTSATTTTEEHCRLAFQQASSNNSNSSNDNNKNLPQENPGVRRRANTYHAGSLAGESSTMSTPPQQRQQQQQQQLPPPSFLTSPSEDDTTATNHTQNDNTAFDAFQQRSSSNDSADEEMKIAMAMALAVQSNPNLTPEELKQLMATTVTQQQQQQQPSKPAATAATTTAAPTHTTTPKSASMLIPGRLSNVFHLSTSDIESSVHSINSTSNANSSSNNNNNSSMAPAALQKSVKANFKNFQESFRTSGIKARERIMDIVGTKSNDDAVATSPTNTTTATTTTTPYNGGGGSGSKAPLSLQTVTRPLSPGTYVDTPSSSTTTGKRSPFRSTTANLKSMVGRSPPMPTIATSASEAESVNSEGGVPDVAPKGQSTAATAVVGTSTTYTTGDGPIRLTTIVWKRRSGLGKYSVHSAWERRRIVLQGPKLSYFTTSTNHDSIHNQNNNNNNNADSSSLSTIPSLMTPRDTEDSGDVSGGGGGGGGGAPKKTNWFEQATASLVAGSTLLGGEDHTTPRGYVDLIKDGASVAAATGHSGAPTPFAISIKVRGETKWKLCFDMHKTQMEWLAALTDVVVQGSVDAYNATLVDAMNPAHLDMFQAPPVVYEPPATKGAAAASNAPGGGGGHRLWMLETYTIKSQNQLDLDNVGDEGDDNNADDLDETTTRGDDDDELKDEEEENEVVATTTTTITTTNTTTAEAEIEKVVTVVEEVDIPGDSTTDVASREAMTEDDETEETTELAQDMSTWSIPEKNLVFVASVLNISLALARASTTSIQGFWYLWVFANFGLYQCTNREVQKAKRVLLRKSLETDAAATAMAAGDGVRSSGGTNEVEVTTTMAVKRATVTTIKSKSVKGPHRAALAVATGGFKPVAGTTSVQIQNPTDVPMNSVNHIFAGWRALSGDTLMVRSHGYMATKKKIPSPGELYKLLAIDIFESPRRYPDMAPRVQLPKVHFDDGDKPKTWHSPDLFVISFAIPTDPPKMTGATETDGGGYTVTMYFRMHDDTREILRRITAEDYDPSQEQKVADVQKSKVNAVRLFEEWCRRAPTDPKFQSRFKLVPHAHNLKEIGMPGWISKYNGKPLLIKRPGQTGFLIPHPELSCIEFDISLHVFPFVAKKAICYVKEHFFRKVLVTFGFVIEGRADDELPECVIGLMQLCYPDPIHAIQAKDFFAGKCPRSFD